MSKIIRYLTLPAPKRRKTECGGAPLEVPKKISLADTLCHSRDRQLSMECVRFILMAENEHRVLFDSDAIVPTSAGPIEGAKLSPDGQFQFLRNRRDQYVIGPMLFGAMPSANGVHSFKIHTLGENHVLLSKVFSIPKVGRPTRIRNDQSESAASSESESGYPLTVHSLDGFAFRRSAGLTTPPEQFYQMPRQRRSRQTSLNGEELLEGGSSDLDDLRALSPPHRVYSRTRRMEVLPRNSLQNDSPWSGFRRRLNGEEERTVGMGLILDGEHRAFLLQHMPLIEGELSRLEQRIAIATGSPTLFINNVYEAWRELLESLCVLHNAPRLRRPAWLHLLKKPNDTSFIADFCAQLYNLIIEMETRNAKFFLSNLLSAVLMHHMSWIASVASPPEDLDSHAGQLGSPGAQPCNLHLAQFLEVNGCVGAETRSTKTVVCGSDGDLLAQLLHVVSYFVRCSAIQKVDRNDGHSPCERMLLIPQKTDRPEAASPDNYAGMSSSWCSFDSLTSSSTAQSWPSECESTAYGLGQSLLAGPSSDISPHFVVAGLILNGDEPGDVVRIADEMGLFSDVGLNGVHTELYPGAPIPEHVTIVGDVTDWSVKVLLNDGVEEQHSPAERVVVMLEQFADMYRDGLLAPRQLLELIEDSLTELLAKSVSLVELLDNQASRTELTPERVRSVVDCDHSDLRLIFNIAAVHCPKVMDFVVCQAPPCR